MDIGGTQSQFAFLSSRKKLTRILAVQGFYNLCGAIRRTIVDHQDMKALVKAEDRFDDRGNILLLIVGWYNDDFFQMPVG